MTVLKTFGKALLSAIVAVALIIPSSCSKTIENPYDDSELKEQIELILQQLYDLEQRLNSEIKTLKDLLDGQIFISDVSKYTDGNVVLTFSDGDTLTLPPAQDMESFVTYITGSDGVNYWGYIDAEGKKQYFLDEEGHSIPVNGETPEVVVRDGETYLVIGGKEYLLVGNSIFSGYELITDELTGEVYAVVFTFGEGMTFTVTVDGAFGFYFVRNVGWSTERIVDYYVAPGFEESIQIEARGVVDYVLQIPDGWRVKETEDPFMGTKYLNVTAPTDELIEAGAAEAEGELKVVAVLEGGKATVAKLYLTTEPFKEFSVTVAGVNIVKYNGLQKFVYGICAADEYDEAEIFERAKGLLDEYTFPAGYGVTFDDIVETSLETLAGGELVPGQKYVVWVIPAHYDMTNELSPYYIKEADIQSIETSYYDVSFDITSITYNDANLKMDLTGIESYYVGLAPKDGVYLDDIVYGLNYNYYTPKSSPLTYDGSIFALTNQTAEVATYYVAWFAIAEPGKTYTKADILVRIFSTEDFTSGGSVKVSVSEDKVSPMDVEAKLVATSAKEIYYAFLTDAEAKKYTDDAAIAQFLIKNGKLAEAESVTVKASDTVTKLKPETKLVLFAIAIDEDGKYGPALVQNYTTSKITYNDLSVAISLETNNPEYVELKITTTGGDAVDYLYWVGKTSSNTWKSTNYLGGSAETAQAYMYLNASNSLFTDIAKAYPIYSGKVTMKGLEEGEEYVFVAMAKDKDGGYSKATEFKFTPFSINIGTVVLKTDEKYEAARPTVEFLPEYFRASSGMMPGMYAYNVTVPEGFTAYVISASDGYFTDDYGRPMKLTAEQKIIEVIKATDRPRDYSITTDDTKEYPYSDTFYHAQHGAPRHGNGIIWASEAFHDSLCECGGNFETTGKRNGIEMPVYHILTMNDDEPDMFVYAYAAGNKTKVVDRVFIVCQDLEHNCYETFEYDVPFEHFANATDEW